VIGVLELRVVVRARQLACMREAIARECRRARADDDHVERVCALACDLITTDPVAPARHFTRRDDQVLVLVTAQSDATMLMVRDLRTARDELGHRRQTALRESACRWSTMSGVDGRTIWAEIPRTLVAQVACAP
jgi:hypothetical protein